MVLSNYFETLDEIRTRTGILAEKVIESVKEEMKKGNVQCRFRDVEDYKITEFRKKAD